MTTFITAARVALCTLLLTGIAYPLAVTALSRWLPQASGSLVRDERGRVVGSALIGQRFSWAGYLQGRLSANDGAASGGSNLWPSSAALRARMQRDRERLERENPAAGPVPVELLTVSASGLDPHVSAQAALWQVPRIAATRGARLADVHAVIEAQIARRELGFLGEARVNVLLANLALDRRFGRPAGRK